MELLRQAGLFALLTLVVGLAPLAMALAYVVRPTDHRLALMRPVSLAGLFGALTGGALGFLNVLRLIGMTPEFTADSYRRFATGASESLVPLFVGFAALTAAWLLVAAGMGRSVAGR
jgi:hypothetical protein